MSGVVPHEPESREHAALRDRVCGVLPDEHQAFRHGGVRRRTVAARTGLPPDQVDELLGYLKLERRAHEYGGWWRRR